MGSLFGSKPKKPEPFKPTKQQLEAEKQSLERQKQQESEMAEREAQRRKRSQGGRSSLLRGSALGVIESNEQGMKDTLG